MARQNINNGESGLLVRTKINSNFTELYDISSDVPFLRTDVGNLQTDVTAVEGDITTLTDNVNQLTSLVTSTAPAPIFAQTVAAPMGRIKFLALVNTVNGVNYYVKRFFRDDVALPDVRFQVIIARSTDNVDVAAVSLSYINSVGFTGLRYFNIIPLGGSGITGSIGVDFGGAGDRWANYAGTDGTTRLAPFVNVFNTPLFEQSVEDIVAPLIAAANSAGPSVLAGGPLADSYAMQLFGPGVLGGSDPDDTYWFNYETIFFPLVPLYRVTIFLHSARYGGNAIARWAFQKATLPVIGVDLPPSIYMTNSSQGSRPFAVGAVSNCDPGVTAHVDMNWTALDWTKTLTAYTNGNATGVAKVNQRSWEQTRAEWASEGGPKPYKTIRIGAATGDFPTLLAAVQSVIFTGGSPDYNRSDFPHSNVCSPERPVLFEVVDPNHVEEIPHKTYLGVDQSPVLLPHGSILRLRPDTNIYMVNQPGSTSPLLEVNFTCRIELNNATLDQQGEGYVLHIDNFNGISRPGGAEPNVVRRPITCIIQDGYLRHRIGNTVPNIGMGSGDNMLFEMRGVRCIRDNPADGTDAFFCHDSPNETMPALLAFRQCSTNINEGPGVSGISVTKLYATTTFQHKLIVEDCEIARIEVGNSGGGNTGWRQLGNLSGAIVTGTIAK